MTAAGTHNQRTAMSSSVMSLPSLGRMAGVRGPAFRHIRQLTLYTQETLVASARVCPEPLQESKTLDRRACRVGLQAPYAACIIVSWLKGNSM